MAVTEEQAQFIDRIGSYPAVASTVDQVKHMYTWCKESNTLVKYSLETAESGAKLLTGTAAPIVERLPVAKVNELALNQLDKLEEKYPIVTKPTEEVLEETKKLYESTVKPCLDKVQAVGQYATDTYSGAKEYGVNKVKGVVQFGTEAAYKIRDAGTEKINTFLESPQGKTIVKKLDDVITYAENYVDSYLPEDSEGVKPRVKIYNRTMKELRNLQLRSQETLQNLHFTVDLIEYARTNIDAAKAKLEEKVKAAKETGQYYWDELQKEDDGNQENKTLERRAISVARNLTRHLHNGLVTMNELATQNKIAENIQEAVTFVNSMVWSLMKATNIEEFPEYALSRAKAHIAQLQDSLGKTGELIQDNLCKAGEVIQDNLTKTGEVINSYLPNGVEDQTETETKREAVEMETLPHVSDNHQEVTQNNAD